MSNPTLLQAVDSQVQSELEGVLTKVDVRWPTALKQTASRTSQGECQQRHRQDQLPLVSEMIDMVVRGEAVSASRTGITFFFCLHAKEGGACCATPDQIAFVAKTTVQVRQNEDGGWSLTTTLTSLLVSHVTTDEYGLEIGGLSVNRTQTTNHATNIPGYRVNKVHHGGSNLAYLTTIDQLTEALDAFAALAFSQPS